MKEQKIGENIFRIVVNGDIVLRDFVVSDIGDMIRWNTTETEWCSWDAPWETEEGLKDFDKDKYRAKKMMQLKRVKPINEIRDRLEICVKNVHVGWECFYYIDDDYNFADDAGKCTVGIDIPDMSVRHKGCGTQALSAYIKYLMANGMDEIYTQTWSGNLRMIGLAKKLGFEECKRKVGIRNVHEKKFDGLTFKLNMKKFK